MIEPIGALIKSRLKEQGTPYVRFGEFMGLTERNLQYFFSKDDISLMQVIRASEFLKEDLTKFYVSPKWRTKEIDGYRVMIEVHVREENMERLPEFLNQLREFAHKLGFDIGK